MKMKKKAKSNALRLSSSILCSEGAQRGPSGERASRRTRAGRSFFIFSLRVDEKGKQKREREKEKKCKKLFSLSLDVERRGKSGERAEEGKKQRGALLFHSFLSSSFLLLSFGEFFLHVVVLVPFHLNFDLFLHLSTMRDVNVDVFRCLRWSRGETGETRANGKRESFVLWVATASSSSSSSPSFSFFVSSSPSRFRPRLGFIITKPQSIRCRLFFTNDSASIKSIKYDVLLSESRRSKKHC